ncbi:MAG: BMC domain-containing protein [Acidobacteriota bacterium]
MSPKISQIRSGATRPTASSSAPPIGAAPGSGARDAIGLLELTSVAKGVEATDVMLKAADVELLGSRSICSGKYMILVRGDVAACTSAVRAGEDLALETVADSIVIPNLHEQVFPALSQSCEVEEVEALGILEAFNVATLIEGADAAVKAAEVHLLEIRIAMALGGKAFCILTGSVAAVRAAVEAGKSLIGEKGLLTNWAVIPAPKKELVREILGGRLI